MHTRSGELARRYAEKGFSMLNLGTDYELLSGAVRRELDAADR